MKILVIGPSWIGDMMISQSLYRTIKMRYPQAIIDVMAQAWCHSLLEYMPEVNEAIPMPINHGTLSIGERCRISRSLREKCYDHAYVLPNSFKSALIPFLAGISIRTGWRGEMRYGLLNDMRILDKKAWPMMVERYIALAYDNGMVYSAKDLPQPLLLPQLQINEDKKSHIYKVFGISTERPIIGFCPFAAFGSAKLWPYYHYAELAKYLINDRYQIVLFGSEKDHDIGNKIAATLGTTGQQAWWCHNLAGKTQLKQAVILIAACKAVVTNDSGLMHIAAALDRPLVALYGPSSPEFTPPLSHKARIVCLNSGNYKVRKDNSATSYHQSLIDIKPYHVFEELNKLLLSLKNNRCEC